MLCKKCGCEIPDGSKVCSYCGSETAILKEEKKRKAKKQAKWGCLAFVVIFVLLVASCFNSINEKSAERYKPVANVEVILESDEFSLLTTQELKEKLGKPGNVTKWNLHTKKGDVPFITYTYYWDGFYGDFDIYDDQVVKLNVMASDREWKIGELDSYKGLAMFGIIPNQEKISTAVIAPARTKLVNVSEEVPVVDIYGDKNRNVTVIKFIYNENFDI